MSKSISLLLAITAVATTAAAQRAPVKLPPRPDPEPAKVVTLPKATIDSLPNGVRFAVIENHELPIVTVRVALAGTSWGGVFLQDPPGKPGTYGLMMTAMREGTKTRSSAQLLEEAADLGAVLTMLGTLSYPAPWIQSPRSTWVPSLSLLADFYMNPAFPAEAFPRVRTNLASLYERNIPVGTNNALNIMLTRLYGPESPSSKFGNAASVRSLTLEDITALHREYIRPQNTLIVIAGDVTPGAAREAMTVAFGGWQRGGTTITPIIPSPADPTPTTIYLFDVPNAPQAALVAGHVVPGRSQPDAVAIEVMANILGDQATGRVFTEFRRERGLSYNPRAFVQARPFPETQPLYASAQVSPGVIDTAVLTYIRVLRDLKTAKPFTEAELSNAKSSLVRGLPRQLERLDAVAGNILAEIVDRLPPNYLPTWIDRVNKLTLPELQAATKYLDPDHLVIVVSADRSKVEAALRATGLPVVIVDK